MAHVENPFEGFCQRLASPLELLASHWHSFAGWKELPTTGACYNGQLEIGDVGIAPHPSDQKGESSEILLMSAWAKHANGGGRS